MRASKAILFCAVCGLAGMGSAARLGFGAEDLNAPKVGGWEPVGFSGGGAMFAPAISGADPNLMMINCDMSGAYISRDGGRFWKMIHHAQLTSNIRCAPGFHPKDPNIIYAGSGAQLKISRDKGETWSVIGNVGGGLHGSIAFDADHPSLMLAGLNDGASISRDAGATWTRCEGPRGAAIGFHVDRTSPADRRVIIAATAQGIWRSDDGGATWVEKTNGLPSKEIVHFAGGSDPKSGVAMLYCSVPGRAVDAQYEGGIYRSKDRGETWESAMGNGINKDVAADDEYAQSPVAHYTHVFTTDIKPLTVYAMNLNTGFHPPHHSTAFRSDDGGENWRATLYMDPRFQQWNAAPDYLTASLGQSYQDPAEGAAICPSDPNVLIRTASMPVLITRDGGESWAPGHTLPAPGAKPGPGSAWVCNGLVVTTTWHYYVDPHERNRHYIAYTDIGFARSTDRGKSWVWWNKAGRPPWVNTCYELAFDPEIPGKVWGAFSNVHDIPNDNIISGRHRAEGPGGVCLSMDFCETWKAVAQGLPLGPCTAVVVDPKSPKGSRTLYAGIFDKGVFKSTDDGQTWTAKNNGLGHPANMRVCRVILHKDGALFALITAKRKGAFASEGVGLYRSKDGGESWTCLTSELGPDNAVPRPSGRGGLLWPKDSEVHPEKSDTIFIGAADARDQRQGGLYRTTDGGASWKRVARFGREHFGAYFHPTKAGWVYATMCEGGVDCSLHLSTDGGDTWKPFETFPFSNTQRVLVDPDDENTIYVSTFGGSVFKGPASGQPKKSASAIPVRGLHMSAPRKNDLPALLEFVREALPAEGVNTLILEFNFEFDYTMRPEFANPEALGKDDVRRIAAACREKGIELIPQINCLGHQSWSRRTGRLLTLHPEFDETPGKYPENKGIYCRSYCPLHPEVHKVMFDLIDELAAACEAKNFHVGMDEVFLLADPDCPRCKGKSAADLFAGEVQTLRDHLKSIGCRLWMWGDRFIDGQATGIGEWEASTNGTAAAIDKAPKDIVICDWHYEKAHETARFFAEKGFEVVACPWRKSDVALGQLAHIRSVRDGADQTVANRALGMVQTTWCGFGAFKKAYEAREEPATKNGPSEAAQCFRALFEAMRQAR